MASVTGPATAETAEPSEYPMSRAKGCPFDPPPRLRELQEEGPLAKVKLQDGSTPWLVTRYADQRALLGDPRVSSDASNPGYPSGVPPQGRGTRLSFILMDDPEHARQRRMVTAPFSVKRIEAMRPAVQKIVDDSIDELLQGPNPVDLVDPSRCRCRPS